MRLRPWHVIVCIVTVSVGLIGVGSVLGDRPREVAVGLGLNLLSSVAFFILLEVYWEQIKRANGKEVTASTTTSSPGISAARRKSGYSRRSSTRSRTTPSSPPIGSRS